MDAALADGGNVFGEKRDQALAETEVGFENGEIAVINSDDFRAVGECASEFALVVNFKKRIQSGGLRGGVQRGDFLVVERPHDDENGTGAGLARLQDLNGVNEKIFPNAGQRRRGFSEVRSNRDKVVESAAEIVFVGEHGQGAGGGRAVFDGLVGRGDARSNGTSRGRATLDFGNDGKLPVGPAERAGKRGHRR